MNYSQEDNLVPLTELAAKLGFTPKKESFDEESYIELKLIDAELLYSDADFQRLINQGMIRQARMFDQNLVRPLYVFERPNGKYSVADGQHQGIIGILYTQQGGKLKLPCQVRRHPKDYNLEQCLAEEANFFKKLNFRRRNVGKVDKLRADISIGDEHAQEIEGKLQDMGIHIEMIGDPKGVAVHGYDKIMEAHEKYKVPNVQRAIKKYQQLQNDPTAPKWNDTDKPLNAGLLGGMAAIYAMLNGKGDLGFGDRNYALQYYMDFFLKKVRPIGKQSLMDLTGGVKQDVLIARRIVQKCNAFMEADFITKRDGTPFKQDTSIGEGILESSGLGDPGKLDKNA